MPVPSNPKIYHIVHIDNLAAIVADGCLWPDSIMVQRRGAKGIGNNEIKSDRLGLPVFCHLGTMVGQYVPFYFCPRSVMLYVISKRNHPNVVYRDGQGPVVHLVADLQEVVAWANGQGQRWAFTDINAANRAADFFNNLNDLSKIDWTAVDASSWVSCRDHKMAEFLMHDRFPWELVRGIGVHSQVIAQRASDAMHGARHRPAIEIKRAWYY